jgi:hypothetical protein
VLYYGITVAKVVLAFFGVVGFIGRVITALQERRDAEKQRQADRERIIAQQDRNAARNAAERRQERISPQQRRDAAETQDQ